MTTPATLRALAAELCEAKEGSRELRARIYCTVGGVELVELDDRGFGFLLGNGKYGSKLWSDVPDYCNSLDAKLPGEDIGCVYAPGFGTNRGAPGTYNAEKWHAVAVRRLGGGRLQLFRVEAHTEPLARRAAGLLAMAQEKESA